VRARPAHLPPAVAAPGSTRTESFPRIEETSSTGISYYSPRQSVTDWLEPPRVHPRVRCPVNSRTRRWCPLDGRLSAPPGGRFPPRQPAAGITTEVCSWVSWTCLSRISSPNGSPIAICRRVRRRETGCIMRLPAIQRTPATRVWPGTPRIVSSTGQLFPDLRRSRRNRIRLASWQSRRHRPDRAPVRRPGHPACLDALHGWGTKPGLASGMVAGVERADDAEVPPRSTSGAPDSRAARRCCRGCMSAWKKLCRSHLREKIVTPSRRSRWMLAVPAAQLVHVADD